MTAEQYHASGSGARAGRGLLKFEQAPAADLFGQNLSGMQVSSDLERPHPDFAARSSIWKEHSLGLISLGEAQRRSAAIGRAPVPNTSSSGGATSRPRHTRPAPNGSRQYSANMATTAARDDRLTPNAKAFLQVLRARCGKGRETSITKGTMGAVMARSPRTIRRYLVDLVRFGYIELETRRNGRGMHLGLVVRITAAVTPFYEDLKGLAKWLAETPAAAFRPFEGVVSSLNRGVTLLTPKNQTRKYSSLRRFKTALSLAGAGAEGS